MHRILGTLDDYMKYSSDPPLNRLHAKGEKEKFIKEFLFLEAQEPTPSNPYVSHIFDLPCGHSRCLCSHKQSFVDKTSMMLFYGTMSSNLVEE